MNFKILILCLAAIGLTSCLKTRGDLGEQDQSRVYGKKSADNQGESQLGVSAPPALDERDELIRAFNGRIENLENQINTLKNEKAAEAGSSDSQKIQLMQEALTKMEAQIQRLEAEVVATPVVTPSSAVSAKEPVSSDAQASNKVSPLKKETVASAYDSAQDFFARKEWKKAILSYQKYVDENSKGKNVADAKYKIGVCFQELNMKEEAMAFYEEVIANYNKTEAGKKAKIRLAKLKK
ncbi:MAG: hypothetical protein A2622_03105 [Bdellovibrionales bacterium RIFCSPHIGHO2_01_FULL_40_29]|nr:MAG: hypothetical protein A2622_03105 [Bdellovibrionales bacterium RIFCSPHIGHO2_01_FULL_40_29]OFZ34061.1 MAG: hypothetical protein A3D17_03525 [Bdellovibrionales bacterium RIFCSPHIGHO2_02_FULL_40_15]